MSFSKNLGLYRERVGALIVDQRERIARRRRAEPRAADRAQHLFDAARSRRGDRRAHLCGSGADGENGSQELDAMRTRISDMRALLAAASARGDRRRLVRFHPHAARHVFPARRVRAEAVERLREKHHIYMTAGQPHESRRHHAAQRRPTWPKSIAAERSLSGAPSAGLAAERLAERGDLGGGLAHHGQGLRLVQAEPLGGRQVVQGGFEAGDIRRRTTAIENRRRR